MKRITKLMLLLLCLAALIPAARAADWSSWTMRTDTPELQTNLPSDHSHCLCISGATCSSHAVIEWTAWESATSLPSEAGQYYLTQDIALSAAWQVTEDVDLCLNGHHITLQSGVQDRLIVMKTNDVSLRITDCSTTCIAGHLDESGLWRPGAAAAGETACNLTGGVIYGGHTTADIGGAVLLNASVNFELYGGNIAGSYTKWDGGGIGASSTGSLTLQLRGGEIVGNAAKDTGGAVYLGMNAATILSGTHIRCNTSGSGAAFTHSGYSTSNAPVTITGGEVSDNASGGISIRGCTFSMTDCLVSNNAGTGLFASSAVLEIADSHISGNAGLGISLYNSTLTMEDSTISHHVTRSNGVLGSQNGGGLYINADSSAELRDVTLLQNTASAISSENNSISVAAYGGGVYCAGTLEMTGGSLDGNLALADAEDHSGDLGYIAEGGGLYAAAGSSVTLNGTAVLRNEAQALGSPLSRLSATGGGISMAADAELTILGGSITENKAVSPYANSTSGGLYASYMVQGGGLYVPANETITLGGGLLLRDNTRGTADAPEAGNLYLCTGALVQVSTTSPLTTRAAVHVRTQTEPTQAQPVPVTTAASSNNQSRFVSDADYNVQNVGTGSNQIVYLYPAHAHIYGDPVFSWTQSGSGWAVSYIRSCTVQDCSMQTEAAPVDEVRSNVAAQHGCTTDGRTVYTAAVTLSGVLYTSEKTVTIPMTGHSYTFASWQWSLDYSTATALFTCGSCSSSTRVQASVSSSSTANGETVYTATVSFENQTYTDTQTVTVHQHCICAAEDCATHAQIQWTAWPYADRLPSSSGNYYLTQDVTTDTWTASAYGDVSLCLNGKTITTSGLLITATGRCLKITDCSDASKPGHLDADSGRWQPGTGSEDDTPCQLTGGLIHTVSDAKAIFSVIYESSLELLGGNFAGASTYAIQTGPDATVTMTGGSIVGNGGGIKVSGADIILSGGSITQNVNEGVCLFSGAITMEGGEISHNRASGIKLYEGSSGTISGGSITGNTASPGAGVYVAGGTLEMTGGSITRNTARGILGGAGVYVTKGSFTMSGGSITDNQVLDSTGMANRGAAIHATGGSVTLSGAVTIHGNTANSAPSNLLLNEGVTITLTKDFAPTVPIGVAINGGVQGVFTSGWALTTLSAPTDAFISENEKLPVILDRTGELALHQHSLSESSRTEPSYTTPGAIHYSCSCGQTTQEPIPATGQQTADAITLQRLGGTLICSNVPEDVLLIIAAYRDSQQLAAQLPDNENGICVADGFDALDWTEIRIYFLTEGHVPIAQPRCVAP